jgi:hypothetical protein
MSAAPAASPTRGVIAFIAVIVGVAVMYWSFSSGIVAALDGSGSGSAAWQVVFVVALLLVIASIVVAVTNLVRGRSRLLGVVTIVVGLIPIVVVAFLWLYGLAPVATR